MRKPLLLLVSLFVLSVTYSQKADSIPSLPLKAEQLMIKARTQKTAGWIMVGTGVPLAIASVYVLALPRDVLSKKGAFVVALAGGVVCTLAGMNFITKGSRNKKRALQPGLRSQRILLPHWMPIKDRMQLAVSLSVSF